MPTGYSVKVWSELGNKDAVCPKCSDGDASARYYVIAFHLNDRHRWTREKIADWYEATFEQTDESLIAAIVEEAKRNAAEKELVPA